MRSPEMRRPGAGGRTGAAAINCGCDCCSYSKFLRQYQVLCRLIFPQSLIGPAFEPSLSLAKDPTLADLEAVWT